MASTYVNNLRLNEMATGDASGTWGTTTNTNLELVGQALGYGTEAITTNADTHASTVADGAADEARAMYIKYTGTLDSACTITIGPNTLKRVHIIENATSGSQSIIIKQGSGATVTIPTGRVAVVYLDGAGSGAAVTNAFTDLDLAGTLSIAGAVAAATDMTVGDDLTLSSDAGVLGFGADTDVTLTHVADTGLLLNSSRQLQFGDSGTYIHQSADGVLDLVADTEIEINATTIDMNGAVDISGNALVSGEVQTANIGYTDGDNAIVIADGGGITAAAGITSTAASNTFGATSFNDADITNVGSIALDTITNDGTDITLDSGADINLDADGGNVMFKDGGTEIGLLANTSTNFVIMSRVDDKDIIFKGKDSTSTITALTLDMSDAGKAAFNAGATFASNVAITTADNTDTLTLISTDADAAVGPVLNLYRNSSSPADNDLVGQIKVVARNDNSQDVEVFRLDNYIVDVSDGTEDSVHSMYQMRGGTMRETLSFGATELVINDASTDLDFRVESNGNANMLFVDAGNDRVGIAHSAPDANLHAIASANNTQMAFIISNEDHTDNSTSQAIKMGFGLARDSGTVKNDAGSITVGKDAAWTADDSNIDSFMSFGTYTNNALTEKLRLSSNVQVLANGGAVSTPTFSFINDTNTGMTRPTSDTLQFVCGGTVKLRVSGDGLLFNSDTAAANALDDYEEGTWTPTFQGATLTTAVGNYTKIGNQVTVHYHLVTDGGLPSSGTQVQVGGLPFAQNSGNLSAGSVYCRFYTPNDSTLTMVVQDGESAIRYININEQSFDYTLMGELEASANNSIYTIGTITYII